MSAALPSLEDQAERWLDLNDCAVASELREHLEWLVNHARAEGLRIEITQVSHAPSMGATHEIVTVTPSREGYQSTT